MYEEHAVGTVSELEMRLYEELGVPTTFEWFGETLCADTNVFTLTITLSHESLVIYSIDVHGNRGLGNRILSIIHSFAEEHDLAVTARHVRREAIGFWRKMGYAEGAEAGEYHHIQV